MGKTRSGPLRNVYKLFFNEYNILKYQFRAGVTNSCDLSNLIFFEIVMLKDWIIDISEGNKPTQGGKGSSEGKKVQQILTSKYVMGILN